MNDIDCDVAAEAAYREFADEQLAEQIDLLTTEIEALRKDAERYHWIRQNVVRDGNNGVQFDSEIDAAMKEQAE